MCKAISASGTISESTKPYCQSITQGQACIGCGVVSSRATGSRNGKRHRLGKLAYISNFGITHLDERLIRHSCGYLSWIC